jgi:uncharacterized protein YndB with AHSA1/START domain
MTVTEIRRELVLDAPIGKVWEAVATRKGWLSWFGGTIEGGFEVGETVRQDFEGQGTCYLRIIERTVPETFAFQWHPGEDCMLEKYPDSQMTTVQFSLSSSPSGTMLTMIEFGFDNVPVERRQAAVEANEKGWDWELEELQDFVERGIEHSKA